MPRDEHDHPPIEKRQIRLDGATPLRGDESPNGVALTGPLRLTRTDSGQERRREVRYLSTQRWAWLGWRRWRGFKMNDALIINISRGGALVFIDEPPPPRRRIWLYVETPALKTVMSATILERKLTRHMQCAVRIKFQHAPPVEIFDVAVCGLAATDPKNRIASHFKD